MAAFHIPFHSFLLILFLAQLLIPIESSHRSPAQTWSSKPRLLLRTTDKSLASIPAPASDPQPPLEIIEVSKPIDAPPSSNSCRLLLFNQSFGDVINSPPSTANYAPPPGECGSEWSLVVLEWKAASQGVQYDRISGVWLGGVEILRTCTAEPTEEGVEWTVQKDITRYSTLLRSSQTLSVEVPNRLLDGINGIYNVTISAIFYAASSSTPATTDAANVILPLSATPARGTGLWFVVENEEDTKNVTLKLPRNIYRAVLEVGVSFHGDDEFWYIDGPTSPTDVVFREVVVSIDGQIAGAVWPFVVIYTGGINPGFWQPIVSIGAFNLPSYDLDITPFVGMLVDGKEHTFTLSVTNSRHMWYVDANLHLWLDESSSQTQGAILEYTVPPLVSSLSSQQIYNSTASRSISISGYVQSSKYGNRTSSVVQNLSFFNVMTTGTAPQSVRQGTRAETNTSTLSGDGRILSKTSTQSSFPFALSSSPTLNISHALIEHKWNSEEMGGVKTESVMDLDNSQVVSEGDAGAVTAAQDYKYRSSGGSCFSRSVRVEGVVYVEDTISRRCS